MDTKKLAGALEISIKDEKLFKKAFTHKSYANEHRGVKHNERLEFLGDAVLELVVTEYLFTVFPEEPEGKMTKLRSALVSGVSLSEISKKLKLGDYLQLSHGEDRNGGRKKNPILANLFEAVIGAIFLDSGFTSAKEFISIHVFTRLPEVIEKELHLDPKSAFQEHAQETLETTPEYRVLKESGPDHKKIFLVGVFVGKKQMGKGEGSSKQKAEAEAAKNALQTIS